jgi:hypothetical protein
MSSENLSNLGQGVEASSKHGGTPGEVEVGELLAQSQPE